MRASVAWVPTDAHQHAGRGMSVCATAGFGWLATVSRPRGTHRCRRRAIIESRHDPVKHSKELKMRTTVRLSRLTVVAVVVDHVELVRPASACEAWRLCGRTVGRARRRRHTCHLAEHPRNCRYSVIVTDPPSHASACCRQLSRRPCSRSGRVVSFLMRASRTSRRSAD